MLAVPSVLHRQAEAGGLGRPGRALPEAVPVAPRRQGKQDQEAVRGLGASIDGLMTPPDEPRAELQVGGQAVIEGVVMRTADRWALAVRKPSGEVHVTVNPILTIAQKHPRWNKFPLRGIFALADSLIIGVKALSISAGISLEETADESEGEETAPEGPDNDQPEARYPQEGDVEPDDGSGPEETDGGAKAIG